MHTVMREQFLDTLGMMVHELENRSIDYRAIGSVAAEACNIFEVDFSPRNAVDQIDQNPDLDIIVPRADLEGAREVRTLFERHDSYPLKLGLAIPSMQVDLHSDQGASRLTWGRHAVLVQSSLFEAEQGSIGDISLRTVSAETLRHFYSCLSPQGPVGAKYASKLVAFDNAIGKDLAHRDDDPYTAFHTYAKLMHRHTPLSRRTMNMFYQATARMTPEQRNHFRHIAFKMADLVGWR